MHKMRYASAFYSKGLIIFGRLQDLLNQQKFRPGKSTFCVIFLYSYLVFWKSEILLNKLKLNAMAKRVIFPFWNLWIKTDFGSFDLEKAPKNALNLYYKMQDILQRA